MSKCSLSHQLLPKDQQTKPEEVNTLKLRRSVTGAYASQDYAYLSPIIEEIEAESRERDDLEAMVVSKRKK